MTAPAADPHVTGPEAMALDLRQRHVHGRGRPEPIPLLAHLDAMPGWLDRARARLTEPEPALAKASDWLLDNDYLVERAVRQVAHDLPAGFYARLPRLAAGDAAGLPRVFSIAHGLLHASHLQLSLESAVRYVNVYQGEGDGLTIAELWAFPALLRVACLELLVGSLARVVPDLPAPTRVSLPATAPTGLDDTDCVARALANLGVIDAVSWNDFFGRTSRVEAALAGDPAAVYAQMEFETRDRYRHVVERFASDSARPEREVAQRAVERARAAAGDGGAHGHVGHWLVGEGAPSLAAALGCRPRLADRLASWARRRAGPLYGLALGAATAAAIAVPVAHLRGDGAGPLLQLFGMVVTLLPASVVSFTLVHWLITRWVAPTALPKLDFGKGIPPDCRCAVVIPALAASEAGAQALVEQLETHYLSNLDPAVEFALLSDWPDAPAERMPNDEAIANALRQGVRELNARYGAAGAGPFHLLHRPRRWNPVEGCWMGWERKRGKLEEFDRLLLGEPSDAYAVRVGDDERLRGIRFVVTVDADTSLPPGSVARLAGTLAHPLNRARFDEVSGRVVSGYTVIQPRVEVAPEAGNRSWFARLYSGDTAIDIYTRAVSDLYQDLFGSGIFVGKGIYEVETFRRSLAGRVPENALASHDLFEGVHGRAALASDIVLYEGFPSRYLAFARRWHRWVRGDWQLLPWLGRSVPGPGGTRLPNRLGALDRWKILDNLRRSLLPPALVLMLATGWLLLPGSRWVWTILGLAAPAAYLFTDLVTGLSRGRRRGAVRGTLRAAADQAGRWLLSFVFLVQDAAFAVDAIARTSWRLAVSRRGLLEWTSAADVEASLERRRSHLMQWSRLAIGPLAALALAAAIATFQPDAALPAAPVLLLWALSPEVARWAGRPRVETRESLSRADQKFLRGLARRTWLFFEMLMGPEDHWLPPDNLQEHPRHEIAHRTSPTNIGMALLSTLSAVDLGYLGLDELAVRLRSSLETLGRLPRHRGHFLNWIETRSLAALEPRYVSTVDSGNLAVSLIALGQGCAELAQGPALRVEAWDGLADELALLGTALAGLEEPAGAALGERVRALREGVVAARARPERWCAALAQLGRADVPELDRALASALGPVRASVPAEVLREIRTWLERAHHHLRTMQRELDELAPWLPLLDAAPAECEALARALRERLPATLRLAAAEARCAEAADLLGAAANETPADSAAQSWLAALRVALDKGAAASTSLREALRAIGREAEAYAGAMDFRLLYDTEARRFRIGYNASADRADPNHYDLLASEARLASFFAIAKGDVPLEHWFHLGRPIARASGGLALVSWGGSMFEYLMPPLLLRSQPGTLLEQSERAAVDTQRSWGRRLDVPWGVSESSFAALDPGGSYRYQSFGVPGLGLRRGLARDRVVAPYATALALPIRPRAAAENLRTLEALTAIGHFGLFEAVDFTPERVPEGFPCTLVRSYMAHHQGMILTALDNALRDDVWVRRFHSELRMRSTELLLHERIPRELPPESARVEAEPEHKPPAPLPMPWPWVPAGVHEAPRVQLLGNGRMSSWLSKAGAGGLAWQGRALTRWRPDATRDDTGLWLYVHDEANGEIWSVGRQPVGGARDETDVLFHASRVEFHRRDREIGIRMEVVVAAGDDLEIRRVSVTNEGERPRTLRLTSYAEVVLAPPLEDERHPAFSKLFVGAEWIPHLEGLLYTRRPRGRHEQPPVLLHRVLVGDERSRFMGFETDRRQFLGRGGDARRPRGVAEGLSDTAGFTLDPVMALQVRVELEPGERAELAFLTFAGGSRESVLETAERYTTLAALDWTSADAMREAAREAQRLGLEPAQLPALQAVASLLLHPQRALAAAPERRASNRLGQSRLWGLGISGDLPILLVHASDPARTDLLELAVRGHELWRRRGLAVDLVVVRRGVSAYLEPLRERLFELLRATGVNETLGQRGGVHLVFADQVQDDELGLLECAARVVLDEARGSLADQLAAVPAALPFPPPFQPAEPPLAAPAAAGPERPAGLLFDNGIGGFTPDGREYVIQLEAGAATPTPWCNVIANDESGCVVSEAGLGFTWCGNSGENRLTPWSNDPVVDPQGEAVYLRDEQSGEVWTPTPRPRGGSATCQVRHGAGYTLWRRTDHGLEQELLVFVPVEGPVKIARLRLRNLAPRSRRVTATYWAEWVLGALPSVSRPHVVGEWDPGGPALLARNPWSADFGERVAFLTATRPPHSVGGDRREFLGPVGDPADPAALRRWGLSGRVGPGADAGAAYQVHFDLPAEGSAEVAFVLGQGRDRAHALELVAHWREAGEIERALEGVHARWDTLLGALQVKTPDDAFDLLANRWLLYQATSSRLLARAGFHQAGGAFGFRDQLQDVLALLHVEPARARAHLLACAAHQFEEGDVLHWWHPPLDRGVRTRCSDDLLWLPFAVGRYVEATGDLAVLDEQVPFLRAPLLAPDEGDRYTRFESGPEARSLLQHCERALERGITSGPHGLPRIGSGDWNDGFDRVGAGGRGESVWLGWFAVATLRSFAAVCERRGDAGSAKRWRERASALVDRVESAGWDGEWYARAFDDDGRPWGSRSAEECRIDSIAQSWAVLCGAGERGRGESAVRAARRELVDEEASVVRLLWPPFDATPRDPGYIKAYPPGVRENGGQYTHAAAWLAWAFAELGDGDAAHQLFEQLSPVRRAATPAGMELYRGEPYVLAADIGSVPPHRGRAGWTWYTGSAAWTWRLAVEAILGLRLRDGRLELAPRPPRHWDGFTAELRGPGGRLAVRVRVDAEAPPGLRELRVDGVLQPDGGVAFPSDGGVREVELRCGRR